MALNTSRSRGVNECASTMMGATSALLASSITPATVGPCAPGPDIADACRTTHRPRSSRGDHTGGLLDAMELCPQATLVTNFFSVERLALEKPALPLERMRWIDEGGILDAGDRALRLFKPPIFDGPTTRGLFDPTTAAMWIVDSFACLTPGTLDMHEMPRELVQESMPAMNSLVSPWHQWLDPAAYRRHVDEVEVLGVLAVGSAHGPVITGDAIREAFEVVRRLAGQPIIPAPGQNLLDDLITQVLAA